MPARYNNIIFSKIAAVPFYYSLTETPRPAIYRVYDDTVHHDGSRRNSFKRDRFLVQTRVRVRIEKSGK